MHSMSAPSLHDPRARLGFEHLAAAYVSFHYIAAKVEIRAIRNCPSLVKQKQSQEEGKAVECIVVSHVGVCLRSARMLVVQNEVKMR